MNLLHEFILRYQKPFFFRFLTFAISSFLIMAFLFKVILQYGVVRPSDLHAQEREEKSRVFFARSQEKETEQSLSSDLAGCKQDCTTVFCADGLVCTAIDDNQGNYRYRCLNPRCVSSLQDQYCQCVKPTLTTKLLVKPTQVPTRIPTNTPSPVIKLKESVKGVAVTQIPDDSGLGTTCPWGGRIWGIVYFDRNHDGYPEPGDKEVGLDNIVLSIRYKDGSERISAKTNDKGIYVFNGLPLDFNAVVYVLEVSDLGSMKSPLGTHFTIVKESFLHERDCSVARDIPIWIE